MSGYCNPNALAERMGVGESDYDEPHDPYCGWCDAHETAGESHRDDCPLRASPCRGCGSIHCDSECAEFRAWLTVAYLAWDAAEAVG